MINQSIPQQIDISKFFVHVSKYQYNQVNEKLINDAMENAKELEQEFYSREELENFDKIRQMNMRFPPFEIMLNDRDVIDKNTGKKQKVLDKPQLLVLRDGQKQEINTQQEGQFAFHCHFAKLLKGDSNPNNRDQIREIIQKADNNILLLICITVYNESYEQLHDTLESVYENLKYFHARGISDEDIAVIVMFDGIEKMSNTIMEELFDNIDKFQKIGQTNPLYERQEKMKTMRQMREEILVKKEKKFDIQESCYVYQFEFRPPTPEEQEKQFINVSNSQVIEGVMKQAQIKAYNNLILNQKKKKNLQKKNQAYNQDLNRIINFQKKFESEVLIEQEAQRKIDEIFFKRLEKQRKSKKNKSENGVMQMKEINNIQISFPEQNISKKQNNSSKKNRKIETEADLKKQRKQIKNEFLKQTHTLFVYLSVKLINQGKLSSHMWFFRGYCQMLNPKYCVLIDVGTVSHESAIFKMFQTMEGNENIGGCCGYMGVAKSKEVFKGFSEKGMFDSFSTCLQSIFKVDSCQIFEYSMAHIMDKSFESLTGFIHVLPGAFSAYRWDALKSSGCEKELQNPDNFLDEQYLVSVLDPTFKQDSTRYNIEVANMFLAEDRILCMEIYCRYKRNYILQYVPDAYCKTDAVPDLINLIKQRRRWINGSWHALNYVSTHYNQKLEKNKAHEHSATQRALITLSVMYAKLNQLQTYLAFGIFFFFLQSTSSAMFRSYFIESIGPAASIHTLVIWTYILCVLSLLYTCLFLKVDENKRTMTMISSFLGFFMLIAFSLYLYLAIKTIFLEEDLEYLRRRNVNIKNALVKSARQLKVLVILNILLSLIPSLINFKKSFFDLFPNLLEYIYYSPVYLHTFLIYAFCNIDDFSWGTKNQSKEISETSKERELELAFKQERFSFVSKWILWNFGVGLLFSIVNSSDNVSGWFILGFSYYVTINLGIRSISSIIYTVNYYLKKEKEYFKTVAQMKPIYLGRSKMHEENQKILLQILLQDDPEQFKKDIDREEEELKQSNMLTQAKIIELQSKRLSIQKYGQIQKNPKQKYLKQQDRPLEQKLIDIENQISELNATKLKVEKENISNPTTNNIFRNNLKILIQKKNWIEKQIKKQKLPQQLEEQGSQINIDQLISKKISQNKKQKIAKYYQQMPSVENNQSIKDIDLIYEYLLVFYEFIILIGVNKNSQGKVISKVVRRKFRKNENMQCIENDIEIIDFIFSNFISFYYLIK